MSENQYVFVYGTLKRGEGNHRVMERADGKFLDEVTADAPLVMWSLGGFPAVAFSDKGNKPVTGELYEVAEDNMWPLDVLEGYPDFYNRTQISVTLSDGGTFDDVWVYHLEPKDIKEDRIISSGIW